MRGREPQETKSVMTLNELYAIIAAWADEQRGVHPGDRRP